MRQEIEKYINENYDTLQEYPWNEYPNYTTFKHKNNLKWFASIMDVPFEKLGIDKDGIVNVINLKNIPEMLGGLRKDEGILPAYHMNKEHWITILLDGSVPKQKICDLIDISYDLTVCTYELSPKKQKRQMYGFTDKVIYWRIIYLEAVDNPNAYQGITE